MGAFEIRKELQKLSPEELLTLAIDILERLRYWSVLGYLWEWLSLGKFYAPEVVKAAEAYEKEGKLKKALELYKKGIEKCSPERVQVYDEKTGGDVSAKEEFASQEVAEAVKLVEKCKEKIRVLSRKIRDSKKLKG